MTASSDFKNQLIKIIPNLRAFGVSLTRNGDRADDLVQETLMKAWNKSDSFEEGTNLKAWLFTIMRNEFYSQIRKTGREISDSDGTYAAQLATHPQQQGHLDLNDFKTALETLPEDQREALMLVGAEGFSYEEAAEVIGAAVGTVKSRVSRARVRLMEVLEVNGEGDYGPDSVSTRVITSRSRPDG